MAAYCSQNRTSVLNPFHPIQYKTTDPIFSTQFPDLSVSFNNISAETQDVIRAGGGAEMMVKGNKVYILPSPRPETVRALVAGGANRIAAAPINSVNIACLATLSLVRRIFSNFFFVHQYPGFIDSDHLERIVDQWVIEEGKGKRKAGSILSSGTSKRVHLDNDEEMAGELEDDDLLDDQPSAPPGDRIVWAIPPSRIETAWGDEDEIPEGSGLFIRFVEGTQNQYGERAVVDTILKYFLGCLGSDHASVKAVFETLKKDMGVISGTLIGKELAHMARSIDFGLQCQARVFPVISSGQYLGCCLLGAGFQIAAYGSVYTPVNTSSLAEQVNKAGSHRSSIYAIANIAADGPDDPVFQAVVGVTTMCNLRTGLEGIALTSEQRDQIVVLAKGLRFASKSLNLSAANLAESFRLLHMVNEPIPVDRPIHHSALFEKDRLTIIWSAFGDLAPTCNFVGGQKVDLTAPPSTRAKHVGFRLIKLKDAVVDISTALAQKSFTNCSMNRRSGPFKDRIYSGLDGSLILNAMSQAAGVERGKEKANRAGPSVLGGSVLDDEGF
jgi:hypothetical protein